MRELAKGGRLLAVTLLALAVLLGACAERPGFSGLDLTTGKRLTVEPAGGFVDLSGPYVSPQLGDLRLRSYGSLVTGSYRSKWRGRPVYGRLRGEAEGTLVRFTWAERYSPYGHDIARGDGHLLWHRDEGATSAPRIFGARSTHVLSTPGDQGRSFPLTLPAEPWFATKLETPVRMEDD